MMLALFFIALVVALVFLSFFVLLRYRRAIKSAEEKGMQRGFVAGTNACGMSKRQLRRTFRKSVNG